MKKLGVLLLGLIVAFAVFMSWIFAVGVLLADFAVFVIMWKKWIVDPLVINDVS